jgi:hypothetical protein
MKRNDKFSATWQANQPTFSHHQLTNYTPPINPLLIVTRAGLTAAFKLAVSSAGAESNRRIFIPQKKNRRIFIAKKNRRIYYIVHP